jgi:hypothetical protein
VREEEGENKNGGEEKGRRELVGEIVGCLLSLLTPLTL